ncbi:MAG: hypothetical protein Q8K75_09070 [Chlamydiales bacterium]|nr:hypothetical protein [Chlamydiales bacterium]
MGISISSSKTPINPVPVIAALNQEPARNRFSTEDIMGHLGAMTLSAANFASRPVAMLISIDLGNKVGAFFEQAANNHRCRKIVGALTTTVIGVATAYAWYTKV